MKMRRSLLTSVVLSFAAVVLGVLFWGGGTPAGAVVATMSSAVTTTASGTVTGSPESVAFTGSVTINSKMVTDPDFGTPNIVVLSFDLSSLSGTGLSTNKKYVVSSQEIMVRPLAATDQLDVTFPFAPNVNSIDTSARLGVATVALSFNVSTGGLTGAKVSISGF